MKRELTLVELLLAVEAGLRGRRAALDPHAGRDYHAGACGQSCSRSSPSKQNLVSTPTVIQKGPLVTYFGPD